jgi:beta-1,4-mannosyl-glycoprotein beta-1,4-N-acetylglucosaminyltransferase
MKNFQNYIIFCGDVDEIPNIDVLNYAKEHYSEFELPVYTEMIFYYYNFKWCKSFKWYNGYIVNDNGLAKFEFSDARVDRCKDKIIRNAGWHCSYFMSIKDIARKLMSFSHVELNKPEFSGNTHIKYCIDNGIDLFHRGLEENMSSSDNSLLPPDADILQVSLEEIQCVNV